MKFYLGFIILLMMLLASWGDAPQEYKRFDNVDYEYLRL